MPPGCIGDRQITPSSPIKVEKLQHRYTIVTSQPQGAPATTERRAVYRARAPGVVSSFFAGVTVVNVGTATLTYDLLRNGTSMLTAPLVLGSTVVAYNSVSGSLVASPVFAAGDVFEVVQTASAGTGGTIGQGPFSSFSAVEGV